VLHAPAHRPCRLAAAPGRRARRRPGGRRRLQLQPQPARHRFPGRGQPADPALPGFAVARDFGTGFARRLLLTAPARSGIIAGYLAAAIVRWIVTGTIVTIAAIIGGVHVAGNGIDIAGLLGLGLLANLTAALWACGTAMLLRTEQAGALIQLPVFVLLFLAPVYVPVGLLTGWIHDIARINPATPVLEAGRGLLAGTPADLALSFSILAAGIAVTGIWARRGLSSAERAG
jgi:ABC-2 type transport system permease protein